MSEHLLAGLRAGIPTDDPNAANGRSFPDHSKASLVADQRDLRSNVQFRLLLLWWGAVPRCIIIVGHLPPWVNKKNVKQM